jgi:hypothetical protein
MKLAIIFIGFIDAFGTALAYFGKLSKTGIWILVGFLAVTVIILTVKGIIDDEKKYLYKLNERR